MATRLGLAGTAAVLLAILLTWAPHMPAPVFVESGPAAAVAAIALGAIDATAVLTAVAALAVVALLRTLPYGIGAVITCTIGALVTSALTREFLGTAMPSVDLPSGQLVAVVSLLGAASMVVSVSWRPVVLGLGTIAVLAVAAAAVLVGSASIVGIVGAVAIALVWWPACSIVMLFSPAAAAREAANPLDTAGLAVQRRMGRSR